MRQLERSKSFDIKTADGQRTKINNEGAHDVSEVYAPPRVTAMAEKVGLGRGWALDLTVADEDGLARDFSTQAKRAKAVKKVREDKRLQLSEDKDCRSQTEVE